MATIGIDAGPGTDGQVLVITDLLGLTPDPSPRFVKRYADLRSLITEAAGRFARTSPRGPDPRAPVPLTFAGRRIVEEQL